MSVFFAREVAPVQIINPRRIPASRIPAQRMPVGRDDDYKPSLALLPDGELVMVAFRKTGDVQAGTHHEVTKLWRSGNTGRSWSEAVVLEDVVGRENFLTVTSDGTLLMTSHLTPPDTAYDGPPESYHSYLHRSTDGGRTWERTRVRLEGRERRGAPESAGTATDRNVVELPDGTLLLGVALDNSDVGYMWRSTDSGRTWDRSRRIRIQGWYDNADGFFSNSWTYATGSGKLLHFLRVGEPSPMTPMYGSQAYVQSAAGDQEDRTMVTESLDGGVTWSGVRDFGGYGQMYRRVLRLRDGRLLMTFTQRGMTPPLGLRAMIGYDDGETWDHTYDQIVIEGFTPWGRISGGGFGNTVELEGGLFVSCYSYMGADGRTHVEVVRWRIPRSTGERIIYHDPSLFDVKESKALVPLYDWATGEGATLVPRDFPFIKSSDRETARAIARRDRAADDPFSAELQILSTDEARSQWPGLTLTDLTLADWGACAGFAIRLYNVTDSRQDICLAVRNAPESNDYQWGCQETFDPGQIKTIFATVDEIKGQTDVRKVLAVCIGAHAPVRTLRFLASPFYLVKPEL